MKLNKNILAALSVVLCLSGCLTTSSPEGRHTLAQSLATGMTEKYIEAAPFQLTSWQKLGTENAEANVYIEGDGLAWVTRNKISNNPTPSDPIALRLAARDPAPNVIYLARPCQYSGRVDGNLCDETYWTRGKTSTDVIQSYMRALDILKQVHNLTGFNLIGYSGGAAVAVLVAGQRDDVRSVRTVAGNISYQTFDSLHNVTPADESIDPMTAANSLMNIPQVHFIGGEDDIVPAGIYQAWAAAVAENRCLQSATVPGVSHQKGWESHWPELLTNPAPGCR